MRSNQRGLFIGSKWMLGHVRVALLNQQKNLLRKLLQKLLQKCWFWAIGTGARKTTKKP